MATIKAKHPVRDIFADCSSGNGGRNYYKTKGDAIGTFDGALRGHGFHFDENELFDFGGDNGRRRLNVVSNGGEYVGIAELSWYRMPSGRYEFTGYLA